MTTFSRSVENCQIAVPFFSGSSHQTGTSKSMSMSLVLRVRRKLRMWKIITHALHITLAIQIFDGIMREYHSLYKALMIISSPWSVNSMENPHISISQTSSKKHIHIVIRYERYSGHLASILYFSNLAKLHVSIVLETTHIQVP